MNLDEIPIGEGRTLTIGDEQVAVFRLRDGTVRALGAVCPHRGGPLADGLIDNTVVVCPLHGLTYDLISGAETTTNGEATCTHPVTIHTDGELSIRPC